MFKRSRKWSDQGRGAVHILQFTCFGYVQQINSPADWQSFVDRFVVCPGQWMSKLHFDHLLTGCFGFDPALAARLQTQTITVTWDGKDESVTLQHWSLRWLSKALCAYGPKGCLGDVVNLALAMLFPVAPSGISETEICVVLSKVKDLLHTPTALLKAIDAGAVWIPTHLQHDAERDDTLCWLLLERMSQVP